MGETRAGGTDLREASRIAAVVHDGRSLRILAKTIYRELRQSGLTEHDVMAIAGELLGLVTADVRDRRRTDQG